MAPIDSAPLTVYALRVGNKFFFEPGDKDEASLLKVFVTSGECARYKTEVGFVDLQVSPCFLEAVWDQLKTMGEESVKNFGAPLRVALYRNNGRSAEILWDQSATVH